VDRILEALVRAFASLLHPKMLWLMVWPMIVALVIWLTLAVLYWGQALDWIEVHLYQYALYEWTVSIWPFRLIAAWIGWLLLLLAFVPLVLITAVLIIGVVAMPAMVNYVGEREYTALVRRKGGTVGGSLWNSLVALLILGLLCLLTLPLWLVPLFWPVLPVALLGYFNQRIYRYDALAEYGTPGEMEALVRRWRGDLFVLGMALALVGHIPVVGLFMPVYGGLAFIHYGLARLSELRSEPIAGASARICAWTSVP
jgi:hypothetical protein